MHDLIVIGAGPAGMAAARAAADKGLSVTVLDEQFRAGGQIYRDVERAASRRGDILGPDYADGLPLARGLDHPSIAHIPGATVWQIENGPRVFFSVDGQAGSVEGKRLLIATGALERPMPIPGWTLPGVMTAGAAQILLKQSGIVAERAVIAGSGPLLYLIAAQMVRAGTPPLALVETQTRGDFLRALRQLPGALSGWRYLRKGAQMLRQIQRAGVPRHTGATGLAAEGTGRAEAIRFKADGREHRIEADTILLHHGVVPHVQAARSLNIPHRWDPAQHCFVPETGPGGRTAMETIFVAGDGAGIGGAKAAALAGRIAALHIARDVGASTDAGIAGELATLTRALDKELAVRPFLDAAYPPYREALSPTDSTIICRCEEVTAGDIRRYAGLGCLGPNQTKAFGRPGMGPCQGRYCGLTVTALLSEANGVSPDTTGYYHIRPPIKPVTLGEIASLNDQQEIEE